MTPNADGFPTILQRELQLSSNLDISPDRLWVRFQGPLESQSLLELEAAIALRNPEFGNLAPTAMMVGSDPSNLLFDLPALSPKAVRLDFLARAVSDQGSGIGALRTVDVMLALGQALHQDLRLERLWEPAIWIQDGRITLNLDAQQSFQRLWGIAPQTQTVPGEALLQLYLRLVTGETQPGLADLLDPRPQLVKLLEHCREPGFKPLRWAEALRDELPPIEKHGPSWEELIESYLPRHTPLGYAALLLPNRFESEPKLSIGQSRSNLSQALWSPDGLDLEQTLIQPQSPLMAPNPQTPAQPLPEASGWAAVLGGDPGLAASLPSPSRPPDPATERAFAVDSPEDTDPDLGAHLQDPLTASELPMPEMTPRLDGHAMFRGELPSAPRQVPVFDDRPITPWLWSIFFIGVIGISLGLYVWNARRLERVEALEPKAADPRAEKDTRILLEPPKPAESAPNRQNQPNTPAPPAEKPLSLVSVLSQPSGASVEIDGGYLGDTPLVQRHKLHLGQRYQVVVRKKGYEEWQEEVQVDPQTGSLSLSVSLVKEEPKRRRRSRR